MAIPTSQDPHGISVRYQHCDNHVLVPAFPAHWANKAGDVFVNEAVGTQCTEKQAKSEQGSICPNQTGKTK